MWFADDIERVAQALILSNHDPNFRAGVAALAWALGAKRVTVMPGVPELAQLVSPKERRP